MKMKIGEIKKQFLAQYAMSSELTKLRYDNELTTFFEACNIKTDEDLKKCNEYNIQMFYEYSQKHQWQPTTTNLRLQTAKLFTKWAFKKRIIECDFLEDVKRIRTSNEIHYIPPKDDCTTLLEFVEGHTKKKRLLLMLKLIMYCGLRRSEVCNLKVEDVDKRNFSIKVFGKGKKIVEQPVPPDLVLDIVEYINTERAEIMATYKKLGGKDKGFLFVSGIGEKCDKGKKNLKDGNCVNPQVLYQQLKRFSEKSGIANAKSISPHSLRRFAGTEIYKATGDIKTAKEFLRHSNISTTEQYYVGFDKTKLTDTVNALYKPTEAKKEEFTQDDEYQLFLLLQKKFGGA